MSTDPDAYMTINSPALGVYKEKGSSFKAYVFSCKNESSFKRQLDLVKSQEPAGRHHCWALRVHPEQVFERSNDDGEPGNTAGAPILRALTSHELLNVGCVVVRYFGGIKLGVPGLIRAYGEATQLAIEQAVVKKEFLTASFSIQFGYDQLSFVERAAKELNLNVLERNQGQSLDYRFCVNRSKLEETQAYFESNHLIRLRKP